MNFQDNKRAIFANPFLPSFGILHAAFDRKRAEMMAERESALKDYAKNGREAVLIARSMIAMSRRLHAAAQPNPLAQLNHNTEEAND